MGSYSSSNQSSACILCEPGKYAESNAQLSCNLCDVGHYAPLSGQDRCEACPQDAYQDSAGQTACKACPENSAYTGTGGVSIFDCEVDADFFAQFPLKTNLTLSLSRQEFENFKESLQKLFAEFFRVDPIFVKLELLPLSNDRRRLLQQGESARLDVRVTIAYASNIHKTEAIQDISLQELTNLLRKEIPSIEVTSTDSVWQQGSLPPSPPATNNNPNSNTGGGGASGPSETSDDSTDVDVGIIAVIVIVAVLFILALCYWFGRQCFSGNNAIAAAPDLGSQANVRDASCYIAVAPSAAHARDTEQVVVSWHNETPMLRSEL